MPNVVDEPKAEDANHRVLVDEGAPKTKSLPRKVSALILVLSVAVSIGVAELARRKRVTEKHILAQRIISSQIEKFIYSLDVLRMAARQPEISPGNVELSSCLLGGATCTATDPKSQVPFGLRSNMEGPSALLIGTASNPAHYSANGAPGCDESEDPACPGWTVKAWFWAECKEGQASCPVAEKIHVRYQVAPGPELSHLPASPKSNDLESDPYAYAETVSVSRF